MPRTQELADIGACDDKPRRRRCRRSGMSLGMMLLQKGFGELVSVLMICLLAVYARAIASGAGAVLGAYEFGAGFMAVVFAVSVIFGQYGTGFGAFHVLLASFLYDENRARGFSAEVVWSHVVIAIVQIGAWFLAAFLASVLLPDPTFNRAMALTPELAGYPLFCVFVFELLGKMLIDHVYVFSSQAYNGVWGAFANSVLLGALVAILGPLTGGSLNFFRSLGPHVIEGSVATLAIVPHVISEIVAPILTVIIKVLLFPGSGKNKQN